MSKVIPIGSSVEFQNLVYTVVGRYGNDYELQAKGSHARISAPGSKLKVILNEGTLETNAVESYRQSLND